MDEAFHRTGCGEFFQQVWLLGHADDVLASSLTVKRRAFSAISVNRARSKLREPIGVGYQSDSHRPRISLLRIRRQQEDLPNAAFLT